MNRKLNLALWVVAGILAVVFLVASSTKVFVPKERLAGMGGAASRWVDDFSPGALKAIGALEFLAAAGLIVPAALGIAPVLVPLAATGAVLLFAGAVIMRLRRGERATIIADLVYLAMAAFVAWGRFGPGSFTRQAQRGVVSRARPRRIARGGLPGRGGSFPDRAPGRRPGGWFRPVCPAAPVPATGTANRYRPTTDALQAPGTASPEELRAIGAGSPFGADRAPLFKSAGSTPLAGVNSCLDRSSVLSALPRVASCPLTIVNGRAREMSPVLRSGSDRTSSSHPSLLVASSGRRSPARRRIVVPPATIGCPGAGGQRAGRLPLGLSGPAAAHPPRLRPPCSRWRASSGRAPAAPWGRAAGGSP